MRSNLDECDEFYIGASKMEHKNRDYFAKPIQGGGREAWDYGNTHLSREPESMANRVADILVGIAMGIAIVIMLLCFVVF